MEKTEYIYQHMMQEFGQLITGELDTGFKDNASSPGGYITTADGDAGYYLSGSYLYLIKEMGQQKTTTY